ncbi:MAG: hypothetical protein ACI8ZN_001044 [Bacteroidia bacterium]|jgi:hypothetical protein
MKSLFAIGCLVLSFYGSAIFAQIKPPFGYLGQTQFLFVRPQLGFSKDPQKPSTASSTHQSRYRNLSTNIQIGYGRAFGDRWLLEFSTGYASTSIDIFEQQNDRIGINHFQKENGTVYLILGILGSPSIKIWQNSLGLRYFLIAEGGRAPLGPYLGFDVGIKATWYALNEAGLNLHNINDKEESFFPIPAFKTRYNYVQSSLSLGNTRALTDHCLIDYGLRTGFRPYVTLNPYVNYLTVEAISSYSMNAAVYKKFAFNIYVSAAYFIK